MSEMKDYTLMATLEDGQMFPWQLYYADSEEGVIVELMDKGWAQEGDIISIMESQ